MRPLVVVDWGCALLIIWLGFAVVTALAAGARGRNPWKWLFIGLLFGVFGLIAVLVMERLEPPGVRVMASHEISKIQMQSRASAPSVRPAHRALGDGDFQITVVSRHCQGVISDLVSPPAAKGVSWRGDASLWPSFSGATHAGAVEVLIAGAVVGYLARDDADDWLAMLDREGKAGKTVACKATISGGAISKGYTSPFEVHLDLVRPFALQQFY